MTIDQEDRKQRILAAVIEDYLNSAIPVGSRALSRSHPMELSAATIRNEMYDLEEEGYLQQPHTSAGRTPTVKGYRFYVDHLMKRTKLRSQEERTIYDAVQTVGADIEEVLQGTLNIISTLTQYAAVAVAPRVYHSAIKVVQMVLLNVQQAMVVLMTNTGLTKDFVLDTSQLSSLTQEELNQISNLLTDKLQGQTLDRLNQSLIKKISRELPNYKELIEDTLQTIKAHLRKSAQNKVLTAGVSKMLQQPEFRDSEHTQLLLQVLEQEQALAKTLQNYSQEERVVIRIGTENEIEEMREVSAVVRTFGPQGTPYGSIALLGPTRMLYDRSAAVIDRVATALSETLTEEANT